MGVAPLKDSSLKAQASEARSTGRLNSRVAVAIEWGEAGKRARAEGYTVDISPKGCLAVIPQKLAVGQKVNLINLSNQHSCEAVLVWRGHESPAGWELGIQLQKPSDDFWGLDL